VSTVAIEVITGGVQVEIPATSDVQVALVPSSTPAFEVSVVSVPAGIEPHVHTQSSPLAEWIINHNRGVPLGATVFSPGGAEVEVEVVAVSPNQTRIYFVVPATGTARLS
jgi:hypothetical protein